jgi:hypothetical protein
MIETDEAEAMTTASNEEECRRLLERGPVPADEEANARRRAAPRRRACDLLRRLFFPPSGPEPILSAELNAREAALHAQEVLRYTPLYPIRCFMLGHARIREATYSSSICAFLCH